jgi:hypothetical protein
MRAHFVTKLVQEFSGVGDLLPDLRQEGGRRCPCFRMTPSTCGFSFLSRSSPVEYSSSCGAVRRETSMLDPVQFAFRSRAGSADPAMPLRRHVRGHPPPAVDTLPVCRYSRAGCRESSASRTMRRFPAKLVSGLMYPTAAMFFLPPHIQSIARKAQKRLLSPHRSIFQTFCPPASRAYYAARDFSRDNFQYSRL